MEKKEKKNNLDQVTIQKLKARKEVLINGNKIIKK
jgi:hypothetical protein